MPGRRHLFVPGPTNIPDRVLRAMHRASEDHRSASFPNFVRPLLSSVRELFDTNDSVALFPATGTGGWEAALTNTLPVGATVLQTGAGHFADQWSDSAGRLGYGVLKSPDREWGKAPDPTEIEDTLKADTAHQIEAVLVVHNETSTGVTADLPAVRRALDSAGHPALLLSDGVSAVGSLPYHHDAWGVDVALTGSQKGLMLPAGLTMLALSEKALSKLSSVDTPRAYFDLRPMLEQNAAGYFPYTPPLPLLYGLREALDILGEEGIEAVWARHHRLADGVRAAVEEWGLKRCCEDWRDASNTVTTVMLPQSLDGEALIRHAHEKYSLDLGGGLGPLAGKAFRVGHIGDLNEGMILGALGLIELCLSDLGFRVPFGSGAAAALRSWSEVE